ncbi:O-antigen ligase family protein [Desulforhopalus sp. 52FAK]
MCDLGDRESKLAKCLRFSNSSYIYLASIILLIGFISTSGAVNFNSVDVSSAGSGLNDRKVRVITVLASSYISFLSLCFSGKLGEIFRGKLGLLFCFFCMTLVSIIYSYYWQMTAFKCYELLAVIFLAATLYIGVNPVTGARNFLYFVFGTYTVIAVWIWIQFAIFGVESQRQLAHATPFFNFMLTSRYPLMVGNAVGFLGALVCLFGLYLYDVLKLQRYGNSLSLCIVSVGALTTIFSYTRSALIFLLLSICLYQYLCQKNKFFIYCCLATILTLIFQPTIFHDILLHLQRGDSLASLTSMSGRTDLWGDILNVRFSDLLLGRGYATGSLYKDYALTGSVLKTSNVHNTLLELISFVGLIGVLIWIGLIGTMFYSILSFYKVGSSLVRKPKCFLHNFVFAVLFLSFCRSMMNVTFARLDLFMFLFVSIILYCDNINPNLKSEQ